MAMVIQDANGKAKGISEMRFINIKTAKRTNGGAVYRDKAGVQGVMFNFCPWCGADIAFFEKLEKAA